MTALPRILFVIAALPSDSVSARSLVAGQSTLSGTHASFLLVTDELARRGHDVGLVVLEGQRVCDSGAASFASLEEAVRWCGQTGRVVWCSWGDEPSFSALRLLAVRPWMWLHTDIERKYLDWLRTGELDAIVTVSDLARITALRWPYYCRIGRVHNPLNPFFARQATGGSDQRYHSQRVVFSAYLGETKGAHRVLEMWPYVRQRLAGATLVMAGSSKLYGQSRATGPLGVASAEFESRHIEPLIRTWGSLDACGIAMPGLLTPAALRDLYWTAALGIVNPNWHQATETFSCTAIEMLSSSLPVLSAGFPLMGTSRFPGLGPPDFPG